MTPAQFARVKTFLTATLAITFATLSMAVSIVVHAKLSSAAPSKVGRMIRAWLARRRRPIYRDVAGPTTFRDRVIFKRVPTDPVSGRVLDPDVKP